VLELREIEIGREQMVVSHEARRLGDHVAVLADEGVTIEGHVGR
jgi:hypothetical protein